MNRHRTHSSEERLSFRRSPSSGSSGFLDKVLSIRRKSSDAVVPVDVTGPLGLNLLYSPSESLIDYVFVHGLGGGSTKTWCLDENPNWFWPKTWLPMEPSFRNVRIHTFGYNADWTDSKETALNVHDFGQSLLESMRTSSYLKASERSPIVCVGHSMGGLVIKQALVLARQDPSCADFVGRFEAMVFLATPHRGSNLASALNNILRISTNHNPRAYISNLERTNELLALLNDAFRHYTADLSLFSFYETQPTNLGIRSAMIVQRESAVLGYPGERVALLNANHRGVCKFESPLDSNYISVLEALQTINEKCMARVISQDTAQSLKEMQQIDQYLGEPRKPEDDLKNLEEARINGSCEWFAEKETFQKWADSEATTSSKFYWISAKPATGKSVLSAYVINTLSHLNLDCSYYFFRYGDKEMSTASGLLRSIAFQTALINVNVRKRLLNIIERGIRFDKSDAKAIWRKAYHPAVLGAEWHQTQYWVIDALDECSDVAALFSMLGSIDSNARVKIFFTSRMTGEVTACFAGLRTLYPNEAVIYEEMTFSDTKDDMILYLEANQAKLHVGNAEQRQEMIRQILIKSEGCFLWIRLVLEELMMVWSLQHAEQVLKEIPQDMDHLYQRALSIMASKPPYARKLAQAVLTWTICAIRPPTIPELRAALLIDIDDEVQDLGMAITSLCAQLVHIDKADRILMVHLTARTFLVESKFDSEFVVEKKSGHLRLAKICLRCLCSNEVKPVRGRRAKKKQAWQALTSPLAPYACIAFAEHMRQTTSGDDELANLLNKFLKSTVSFWIEYTGSTRNLSVITQTAESMKDYLQRRVQYTSPLNGAVQHAESWVVDLQRIPTRFGHILLTCPSSIHWLIPPFCPASSAIRSGFGLPSKGIQILGLADHGWDDRIACINKNGKQVVSIACCETIFAIGLQVGQIVLYHNATCQEWKSLDHQNVLRHVGFDTSQSLLVTTGRRDLRVWNVENSSMLWSFDLDQEILAFAFFDKESTLVVATKASTVRRWSLQTGTCIHESCWMDDVDFGDEGHFRRPPTTVAFNPDESLVAIVYRGRPICLWDMEERLLHGVVGREKDPGSLALGTNTSPASVVFNLNEASPLLAVAYEDGDICIFDYEELTLLKHLEANAQVVACSPNGAMLATGNSAGMVQILDFETLQLLYRVNASDYSIRCLTFSADNLRFLDVRGTQCNIWEPAVLSGLCDKSDASTDGEPLQPKIVKLSDGELQIVTIVLEDSGDFFFVGKSDGSVCLYDTESGMQRKTLYRHTYQIPVTCMRWGSASKIIVSADAASRFIVRALQRHDTEGWTAAEKLLDQRADSAILDVLLSPSNDLLVLSTSQCDIIWDIRNQSEKGRREHTSRQSFGWINNPLYPKECMLITAKSVSIVDWESLVVARTVSVASSNPILTATNQDIKSVSAFCGNSMVAVELSSLDGDRSTTQVLVFHSSTFGDNAETLVPARELIASDLDMLHLIGGLGSKLFFFSRALWVCSIDLDPSAEKHSHTRYFPIPSDWRSQQQTLQTRISRKGDLLFTKAEEIAVIKNGLDFKGIGLIK